MARVLKGIYGDKARPMRAGCKFRTWECGARGMESAGLGRVRRRMEMEIALTDVSHVRYAMFRSGSMRHGCGLVAIEC